MHSKLTLQAEPDVSRRNYMNMTGINCFDSSYSICMKKEDIITYVILWSVLIGICLYLIYTGFPFSIYAKSNQEIPIETEDPYLYEQLVAENEKQAAKKQLEEDAKMAELVLKEQEALKQLEEQKALEAQLQLQKQETAAVLSGAVTQISASGNYLSDCFIIDPNTTLSESDVPLEDLMTRDMSLVSADRSYPQILIYHTHATEGFVDSVDGDSSTTVVGVGDYLMELLTTRYGYHVLHVTDAYDLAEGNLNRSRAYNYARDGIEKVLQENPSIEVVIDLHRDGVAEDKHLVTDIDGKQTAQIMFFNGLSKTKESGELSSLPNPYVKDNLAFSLQLEALCDHYYPDFLRSIYVKGYRYNLHVRPKSLLLEVGAQTNTLQEAKNAMEPFAEILDKLLKGT